MLANKKILITSPTEKNLNIVLGEYIVMSCPLTSFFASSDVLNSRARRYKELLSSWSLFRRASCVEVILMFDFPSVRQLLEDRFLMTLTLFAFCLNDQSSGFIKRVMLS